MKTLPSAIAIVIALCPVSALAQAFAGFGFGVSIPKDTRVRMNTNTLDIPTEDGWNGSAVTGYQFKRIRFELEARRSQMSVVRISDAKGRNLNLSQPSDARREDSGFANVYYARPLSPDVSAFVGGSVGVSRLRMRAKSGADCREVLAVRIVHTQSSDRDGPNGGTCTDQGRGSDPVFSWQAMAGLDLRAGRFTISPTARYVRHENVETAAKSQPTREVRFRDHIDYSSIQAAIILRRSF